MLLYVNQIAQITIGKVVFDNINSVHIEESVNELSSTAKIILPRNYKQLNGHSVLDFLHAGDKVIIKLGYDGDLQTEYVGYAREISSDIPIEILCDEMYKLRQNNLVLSYQDASLRQLLADITKGTEIKNIECPDAQLGKYLVNNASTYIVLNKLKEELGLYSRLHDGTLHVGFAWDWQQAITAQHTYTIHENVKKNDLKFRREADFNMKVRVSIRQPDGRIEKVEYGSDDPDAAVSSITVSNISVADATARAQARYKKFVYTGYTGSITGFGIPRTHAGDSLVIKDNSEPDREGTYLIEKVSIAYGSNGFSRTNELAYKI